MLILKLLFTLLLCSPITGQTRINDGVTTTENLKQEGHSNITALQKWETMEKNIKNLVNQGIKMIFPTLMENSAKLNLSKECVRSSLHLISGLKELKPWAFKFLDSSAKSVDGLFVAAISSLGHYDECLDIQVKSTKLRDKGKLLFVGQYCIVEMKLPLPPRPKVLTFGTPEIFRNFSQRDTILSFASEFANGMYNYGSKLGVCIPSKCSKDDLSKIVSLLASEAYLDTSVYRCEVKQENEFTPVAISVIFFYSLIGGLVLVASLIDAFVYNTDVVFKSTAMKLLMAFSFRQNFMKFSSTKGSKSNSLSCLHGIRVTGMIWVITLHTYIEFLEFNLNGYMYALDRIKEFSYQILLNGALSVDTFFFMGGLLVGNITTNLYKDKVHKLNIVMFIVYRVLRILPAYFFVIMFSSLLHMLGSGPVWHSKTNSYYEPCYKYWWTNLIFINNFYSTQYKCFPTTWYIASDFQLYVFSLVIVIPLLRWPKVGISLGVLTVFASILYAGVVTYINQYPPSVVFFLYDLHGILNYLADFNFRPFIHAGPYAMGILAGYLLAIKPKMKITPLVQFIGWILAFTACSATLFGISDWYKNLEYPLIPSLIYASIKRTAWTLGVGWMILCCTSGHGGIINYILSLRVFVPLGRLTFLAYLIHPIVLMLFHGNIRVQVQTSHYIGVYGSIGNIVISYAVAFIVHMLVEVPFANMVRILLTKTVKEENHHNTGKDSHFHEENTDVEKKEDIMTVTFVSDGKSNGIDRNVVVNHNV